MTKIDGNTGRIYTQLPSHRTQSADSRRMDTTNVGHGPLRLIRDLTAWDEKLDCFAFRILVWTDGEDFFTHRHYDRHDPEDPSELAKLAQKIPRSYYLPDAPPGLTLAPSPLPLDSFIKSPIPIDYEPARADSTLDADMVTREARVCEKLLANPHPNICRYYGIVEKDGRIAGLCFQRIDRELKEAITEGAQLDVSSIIEGVKRGLHHLHSLGIVHASLLNNSMINSHV